MIKIKTKLKIILVFSKRLFRFSLDFLIVLVCILYNLLIKRRIYDDNIVFITAAESKYYNHLLELLESYDRFLKNELVIYNLGLTEEQLQFIKSNFYNHKIINFDFNNYPKFISEYHNDKLGSYAWKPIIINNVLNEYKSKVVWLDSGNLLTKNIVLLKILLTGFGLIVPTSSNSIKDWTHPKTLNYIKINNKFLKKNNYASGLVGFDFNNEVSKIICSEWSKYSLIRECIAPKGSSRDNHRQDQAVLTLLLYKYFFTNIIKQFFNAQTNFIFGVLFHKRKIYHF